MRKSTKILLVSFLLLVLFVRRLFFDLNALPEGRFLSEVFSPDSTYSIRTFVSEPALSANAVRCEVVFQKMGKGSRTIYWAYREDSAAVAWLTEECVLINGREMNVLRDRYDFRAAK